MRRLILCLLALFVSACQQVDSDSLQSVADQLQATLDQAKRGVESLTPHVEAMTVDELNKLHSWEYRIEEVKLGMSSAELQGVLAALGKDRWECFAVLTGNETVRLFLKRRPLTYLRYLPHFIP